MSPGPSDSSQTTITKKIYCSLPSLPWVLGFCGIGDGGTYFLTTPSLQLYSSILFSEVIPGIKTILLAAIVQPFLSGKPHNNLKS